VPAGGSGLATPPLSDHILDSITRRRLLEVAGAVERVTTLEELQGAQEAFLASTTHEVLPVHAVAGQALPAAPGPATQAAEAALRERIEAELAAAAAA
jgi:branched-chain amino acid aminotransferase